MSGVLDSGENNQRVGENEYHALLLRLPSKAFI